MKKTFILTASLLASNAFAVGEPLVADLGVRGMFRYCRYSTGQVFQIEATDSCPNNAPVAQASGQGIGFLRGEKIEPSGRECVYRVAGMNKSIHIGINDSCPVNYEF